MARRFRVRHAGWLHLEEEEEGEEKARSREGKEERERERGIDKDLPILGDGSKAFLLARPDL